MSKICIRRIYNNNNRDNFRKLFFPFDPLKPKPAANLFFTNVSKSLTNLSDVISESSVKTDIIGYMCLIGNVANDFWHEGKMKKKNVFLEKRGIISITF